MNTATIVPTDMDPVAEKADEKTAAEVETLRAKLAQYEQEKEAAEAAKLSAEEKAKRELAKIQEETAQLKRSAEFLRAGVSEDLYKLLEDYRTGSDDPAKLAARFQKFIAKVQKDAATSGNVGARVNPTSSGDESGTTPNTPKTKAAWDARYFSGIGK
jgi:flagellar biosynthesis/type III secretory pathway protein FliH